MNFDESQQDGVRRCDARCDVVAVRAASRARGRADRRHAVKMAAVLLLPNCTTAMPTQGAPLCCAADVIHREMEPQYGGAAVAYELYCS